MKTSSSCRKETPRLVHSPLAADPLTAEEEQLTNLEMDAPILSANVSAKEDCSHNPPNAQEERMAQLKKELAQDPPALLETGLVSQT